MALCFMMFDVLCLCTMINLFLLLLHTSLLCVVLCMCYCACDVPKLVVKFLGFGPSGLGAGAISP